MSFRLPYSKIIFEHLPLHKIAFIFLFTASLLGNFENSYSQDSDNAGSSKDQAQVQLASVPGISEIIPLASNIEVRLLRTQKILSDTINKNALVGSLKTINSNLDSLQITLNELKTSGTPSLNSIKTFNLELQAVIQNFKETNSPLTEEISKIEGQRKMWLNEQENWLLWEDSLVTKNTPEQIKITFKKSNAAINTALESLVPKLDELLRLQESSYKIQPKIEILQDEFESFSQQNKELVILDQSDPMFSSEFRDKFNPELWENTRKGLVELSYTNKFSGAVYFWGFLLGIILFISVYLLIKKNNEAIESDSEYKFLANKAFASALFISITTTFILIKFDAMQATEELLIAIIVGVSFCYLLKDELKSWEKQIVYLLVLLVLLNDFFFAINLPTPLIRIYITIISLVLILLCVIWLRKRRIENISKIWTFFLLIGALYFGIVFLAEISGKEVLALYLFDSFIRTAIQLTLYAVYLFIFHGALKWLLVYNNSKQKYLSTENISSSVNQLTWFITFLTIAYYILPQLLVTWGGYSNLQEANRNLMALGINVGDNRITLQLLIASICVLYGSYIVSSLFSRFMMNKTLDEKSLDKGTRLSIAQLAHYLIMFIGFLTAISVLGFDLTNFTIILSALSVGIGFGLQGLVNNFVSGLILLFERPIREGDAIETNDVPWSTVKQIGLRATRLVTYEQSDLVVPNSELVYKNVTNWTLNNRLRNLILPIGVAYGSDIPLVMKTLMDAGKANEYLVKNSVPTVLFRSFGDSVLNLELRVLAKDANRGLSITSAIYQDIYQRFDKANIKIAYPQIDVHLFKKDQ
ncbi:mechanosensitive ion channel family protein [Eudoraea sp.]|uniref:mechanosensitive ion channel family protein n=1 Tax=Eudoraea sp. TaxID=1979955 RepID=UPI003C755C55